MALSALSIRNLDDRVKDGSASALRNTAGRWRPKCARSSPTRLPSQVRPRACSRRSWTASANWAASINFPCRHPAPGGRIRLVIVVDTNVVSDLMRPSPSPQVQEWVSRQAPDELCTTAVTVAEIRYGLERLPDGRRKDSLLTTAMEVFAAFSEFIQPFDADAATGTPRSWPTAIALACPLTDSTPRSPLSAGPVARRWRRATPKTSRKPGST